jgi:hypothetical protein
VTEVFLNLTEVFPCFFLSCKTNVRVNLARTENGPHSSTLVIICVVRLLFVLFYALFVCKCVLPPGDNPNAINKHIKDNLCQHNGLTTPIPDIGQPYLMARFQTSPQMALRNKHGNGLYVVPWRVEDSHYKLP